MKLYVAGIQLSEDAFCASTLQKFNLLVSLLPNIMNAAKAKMGDDVIVFIVLQEYALTSISIPSHVKKSIIKKLQEEVANHPNLILSTGSILYHSFNDALSPDAVNKIAKIAENYAKNADLLQEDQHTLEEKQRFEKVIASKNSMYTLHNVGHLISAETIKHLKSVPWFERNNLILTEEEEKITSDIVYKIGADNPIKHVVVNENTILDIALLICREHGFQTKLTNKKLAKKLATFQVIVSASIKPLYENSRHSAYSIFMDSETGLSVIINRNHPNFSNDFTIYAEQYHIDELDDTLLLKNITIVDLQDLDGLLLKIELNEISEVEALLDISLPVENDLNELMSELENTMPSLDNNLEIQFEKSIQDNQSNTTTSSTFFYKRKTPDSTVTNEHENKLRK